MEIKVMEQKSDQNYPELNVKSIPSGYYIAQIKPLPES